MWKCRSLSSVQLLGTRWTVALQAPLSMEFNTGVFPPLEDLPSPGIKPGSPALQADSLPSQPPGKSLNDLWTVGAEKRERREEGGGAREEEGRRGACARAEI